MQSGEAIAWIRSELSQNTEAGEARAITRMVMEALYPERTWTQIQFLEGELTPGQMDLLNRWLTEIKSGRPVQYVLGFAWFDGLQLKVTPDVLIPRPETEELAQWVDEWMDQNGLADKARIVDFGTGSGCIALALKNRKPDSWICGLDISKAALDIATANGERLGLEVQWLQADLMQPDIRSAIPQAEIWVSNPPYVLQSEASQMERLVTNHEPPTALFVPDDDPLLFYRRLSELALMNTTLPRALFVELHPTHSGEVIQLWKSHGWDQVIALDDMQGKTRMAGAFRHSNSS